MTPETPREAQLLEQNAALRLEIQALKQHNVVLQLKVDAMARKLFGRSSEKLSKEQMQLVFAALEPESSLDPETAKKSGASGGGACVPEAEAPASQSQAPAPRRKRTLEQIIEGLPVTEVVVDPAEVKAEPQAWFCIGAEQTKLIDYTPGKFSCQKIVRRKWVRKDARHLPPITAPLRTLQERCIATPRLLAHTITQRFEQHLPYYRIEKIYERQGVPLPRQTLCGWSGMAAEAAGLIMAAIKREVFADGYVQIDETPVKYQDPQREGACGTGYLWVCHNPVRRVSFMQWHTGRGAQCLEQLVPYGFEGLIQCDGYQAYETFATSSPRHGKITLAGCLAHARRKFFEAKAEGEDPQWVLSQMQQLYAIEARLREARAGPQEALAARRQHSAPIMEHIKDRLEHLHAGAKHLPRSLTGEAIRYALKQWSKLEVFLRDGRVQIDSNLVENAIRPSAIGKKNWLFMGDAGTGDRAATFYTLIGNCHREGINAEAYLTDIFQRLPTETNHTVHRLTPKAWAAEAARRKSAAQATVIPV
jgi:transposase